MQKMIRNEESQFANNMIALRILTIATLVLCFNISNAQKVNNVPPLNITPIHTFFQNNADTTLIFSYESNFADLPTYFILSKKGDTINLFKYDSGFNKKLKMPSRIRDSLYKILRIHESFNIGINRFFTSVNIEHENASKFWSKISLLKPYQIKDDTTDGEGCPKTNDNYDKNIYDGGGISLYLINKNAIRRLYFYAPKYYENEVCPGTEGRKCILKVEELFLAYFTK